MLQNYLKLLLVILIIFAVNINIAYSSSINQLQENLNKNQITTEVTNSNFSEQSLEVTIDNINNIQSSNVLNTNNGTSENSVNNKEQENNKIEEFYGVIEPELGKVNVRSGPWQNIIGSIYGGKFVKIIGEDGDWYIIDYNGQKGYVLKYAFRSTSKMFKSNIKEFTPCNAKVVNCSNLGLNVRDGAWGNKIGWLSLNSEIKVIGEDGDWYKIEYNGKVGYVYKAYVKILNNDSKKPDTNSNYSQKNIQQNNKITINKNQPISYDGFLKIPIRSQRAPENGRAGNYYCGPTSLGMVLDYYGKHIPTKNLAKLCHTTPSGTYAGNLLNAAKKLGMNGSYIDEGMTINDLKKALQNKTPVIINVNTKGYYSGGHYMVLAGISNNKVYFNDPWEGKIISYTMPQFYAMWKTRSNRGIIIKP